MARVNLSYTLQDRRAFHLLTGRLLFHRAESEIVPERLTCRNDSELLRCVNIWTYRKKYKTRKSFSLERKLFIPAIRPATCRHTPWIHDFNGLHYLHAQYRDLRPLWHHQLCLSSSGKQVMLMKASLTHASTNLVWDLFLYIILSFTLI